MALFKVAGRQLKISTDLLQLDFDDVLAEPKAAQGFEWVWRLSFVLFSQTKEWLYKVFSALLAVPLALVWALVFALVSVVHIWVLTPGLRLFDLFLALVRRVSHYTKFPWFSNS